MKNKMKRLHQNGYLKNPLKIKFKKTFNHKPFKQIARDNIKIDDEQLNKEIARKIINPYYFTDRSLRVGFNITLESHNIIHTNSKIFIKPNNLEFGIEVQYNNKLL